MFVVLLHGHAARVFQERRLPDFLRRIVVISNSYIFSSSKSFFSFLRGWRFSIFWGWYFYWFSRFV